MTAPLAWLDPFLGSEQDVSDALARLEFGFCRADGAVRSEAAQRLARMAEHLKQCVPPVWRLALLRFPLMKRVEKVRLYPTPRITIPGVGRVRLRKGRTVPAFGRAWLVERNERWYACFECERLPQQGPIDIRRVCGVDRGTHVLAATSEGELIRNAAIGKRRKVATARLQRELERVTVRDKRGFVLNRQDPKRRAAVLRLARSREHESNARLDHLFKVAYRLVHQTSVVALEALALRNMTRSAKGTVEKPGRNVAAKAGLNRVIS